MNSDLIARFFSVSKMSSARTDVVMVQTEELARDFDDARLATLADEARAAAKKAATVEALHRTQSKARGSGEARRVDKRMDAAVAGFFDAVEDEITYLNEAGDPRAAELQEIIDLHFAGQVSTITRAPYEEELQRVERLYEELTGPRAALVEQAGLGRWVRRIGADLPAYRAALKARKLVTRGDLESARSIMHARTCAVVGHIVAHYLETDGAIDALLAPLVDQQDRIAAIMRARRQGVATGNEGDGAALIDGDAGVTDDARPDDASDESVDEAADAAEQAPALPEAADVDPPTVRPLPSGD